MEDPPPEPQAQDEPRLAIAADSPPQTQASGAATFAMHQPQRKPAGPQLWAVVFTLGGLYYLWTRILGKSLPSLGGKQSGRVGSAKKGNGDRQAEIAAARERQQQRLQTASRAREMVNQAKSNGNVRERTVVSSGNGTSNNSAGLSINQQAQLLKQQQAAKEKQRQLEEKKKKQRQLYLKQKALEEAEEEKRRKDEELGPGWQHREDPNAANAVTNMDPQSGSGGGYKAQSCKRRGGG